MPTEKKEIFHALTNDQKLDQVVGKANDIKSELEDWIKKNPWATLAIAAGLGFLIAKIFSNRKE